MKLTIGKIKLNILAKKTNDGVLIVTISDGTIANSFSIEVTADCSQNEGFIDTLKINGEPLDI